MDARSLPVMGIIILTFHLGKFRPTEGNQFVLGLGLLKGSVLVWESVHLCTGALHPHLKGMMCAYLVLGSVINYPGAPYFESVFSSLERKKKYHPPYFYFCSWSS